MKMRILTVATMCTVLIIGTFTAPFALAAEPQIGPGFVLPSSSTSADNAGKYPSVATFDHTVHMMADTDQQAQYWAKGETDSSSTGPLRFGSTNGDTDYTQAIVATGPQGQVYAMWIDQKSGIKLKRKPVNGDWGATTTAIATGSFLAYLDVTVAKNGQIFAVWNQDFLYRYSVSSDGGNTWSSPAPVSDKKPYRSVGIAAGGTAIAVAFGGGDGHVYASIWNGSGFTTSDVNPGKTNNDFFASAKPAVGPDNTVYVSYRNATGGIFYAERKSDGSWGNSRLATGASYGVAGMEVDEQNNIHFSWASDASGRYQIYYAFKPADGDWQGPVKVDGINSKIVADVDLAVTLGTRAYAHTVFETFDGSNGAQVRYQQFSGLGKPPGPTGTPKLEGGSPTTNNTRVSLTLADVSGNPDSVRTHWDSEPTDSDTWRTLTSPLMVDAPNGVSQSDCETHTLYVQLRTGSILGSVLKVAETFDHAVQVQVNALNPHLSLLPSSFNTTQAVNPPENGAPDGDPAYTRERSFYLEVSGLNLDCSGLLLYTIPGSDSAPAGQSITNNIYQGAALLPGGGAIGPRTFDVYVTDKLGNLQVLSKSITYDPANTSLTDTTNTDGLPVLNATSATTVTVDTNNSIVRTLSFTGINVTDNLYPGGGTGKQFWGVYIANTTSPDIAADDASLKWVAIQVPNPDSEFSVSWNIFTGLDASLDFTNKPGTYYFYVRFLDGAGNASIDALKQKVTLSAGYDVPLQRIPRITTTR